jgi:hypothetical protein
VLQGKVIERVQELNKGDLSKLKPGDIARWFDVAVKIERLAAGGGDPSVLDDLDLSKLSNADLAKYEELIQKASVE